MKTDVYSWRLEPQLRAALEVAARHERVPMAQIVETAVRAWLAEHHGSDPDDDRPIRARLATVIGSIEGGDPDRAASARERVKQKLARRHGR